MALPHVKASLGGCVMGETKASEPSLPCPPKLHPSKVVGARESDARASGWS